MKGKYLDFLFFMLQKPGISARTAIKKLFRKRQVRRISGKYRINLDQKVINLTAAQWWCCFMEMLDVIPEKYHPPP